MLPRLTLQDFVAKWRASTLKERSAAQELADEELLARLLALNLERAAWQPTVRLAAEGQPLGIEEASGATPVLTHEQVQVMLGAITGTTLQGWRDYARILLVVRTVPYAASSSTYSLRETGAGTGRPSARNPSTWNAIAS